LLRKKRKCSRFQIPNPYKHGCSRLTHVLGVRVFSTPSPTAVRPGCFRPLSAYRARVFPEHGRSRFSRTSSSVPGSSPKSARHGCSRFASASRIQLASACIARPSASQNPRILIRARNSVPTNRRTTPGPPCTADQRTESVTKRDVQRAHRLQPIRESSAIPRSKTGCRACAFALRITVCTHNAFDT